MRLSSRMMTTAAVAVFLMPTFLFHVGEAAAQATTARQDSSGHKIDTPKVELFVGYSYLQAVPKLDNGNRLVWMNGASTSIAYNFNRYLGIVADVGDYTNSEIRFQGASGSTVDVNNADGGALSYLLGPRLSFRNHSRLTPFVQVLAGGVHASQVTLSHCTLNCTLLPTENAFAMTAGGGLDIRLYRHLALRLIQAEYMMTRFDNLSTGQTASQNDMRLSSGLVFRFGGGGRAAPPPPVQVGYSCSVASPYVYLGEPLAASGTALNLDPAKTAIYTWSVDGGTVTGTSNTATINTMNIAPGAYTLKCHLSEGDKPYENADAVARYVVKAYEPPTVSCSSNPNNLVLGESSTITADGMSPQNRPLTYSYSAASGTVNGTGNSATFNSTSAATGPVSILCTVSDDKGQTATASTSVTIAPPPPSAEQVRLETRLALHSIFFQTDEPGIRHPDGGLVASQQQTLTTLATDFKSYLTYKPDAHLTLSGYADVRGSVEYNLVLSKRRVVRTKLFLVEHGVPEARIETRDFGKEKELTAANVEESIKQNPDLTDAERQKLLNQLPVILLAKNRRVDVTLNATGQQSTRWYPFNAADSLTLLDTRNHTQKKKATKK